MSSQSAIFNRLEQFYPAGSSYTLWILITTSVTLLFAFGLKLVSTSKCKSSKQRIPGPKVHPVITTLIPLINILRNKSTASRGMLMFQVLNGYCEVFRNEGMWLFWGGIKPILLLYNPETVEPVLNSNETLEKGFEYDFLSSWLKEGLLTSKGEKWRYRRKLLTPAFHFRTLDEYIPVFNEQGKVFANKLSQLMESESFVNIAPLASLCTLDIICETAMGVKINAQGNSKSPYVQALHQACEKAVDRILQPWLWTDFIYYRTKNGKQYKKNLSIMDGFTRKVVAERKLEKQKLLEDETEELEVENSLDADIGRRYKKRLALLDLLLDVHFREPTFTLEDIAEEVDNFMFAGHDTTSSGLSFALYMLGLHPEIQRKVREEINDVLGEDYEKPITTDDVKEFKQLDRVLKETRRLLPPTPFIARELTADLNITGYTIPKGTNCGIMIYGLHRNPKVFPNPERFDPDRFLPENVAGRHPFSYVPFSAGPRNCIGQRFATFEALIVMATILRHFDIVARDPLDKLHVVDEIVLRSETGLYMKFIPRGESKGSRIHDSNGSVSNDH